MGMVVSIVLSYRMIKDRKLIALYNQTNNPVPVSPKKSKINKKKKRKNI